MRHPDTVWTDPTYATEPILPVVDEWLLHLQNRPRPASAETLKKYRNSLASFVRSIDAADELPNLGAMTRFAVDRWVSQQRLAGRAAHPPARPDRVERKSAAHLPPIDRISGRSGGFSVFCGGGE